jgi:alpha-tubulin suppressor-like RCC1 family protein
MQGRASGLFLLLALPLALASCQTAVGSADDRWAGCYDHSCVSAPQLVPGVPPLASLSAKTDHTCGLTPAGEAWCWGDNGMGQLGDGTDQRRGGPVRVAGGLLFSVIAVGSGFTCAVATGGTAYCWGSGASGELGQAAPETCTSGRVPCARSPLAIPGRGYTTVAAGIRHACALDTAGAAFCWGFSLLGETGSTAFGETVLPPYRVPGRDVFATLGAGDAFTCGLTTEGRALCWGSGNRGELGRAVGTCGSVFGFSSVCSPTPGPVATAERFTALSTGNSHACAITPAGTALCWGDNGQGQLGTGTFGQGDRPVVAQNGMAFTAINASGAATCGTPTGAASVCWGLNLAGKLGVGTRVELSTAPLPIQGGRRFVSFAGGQDYVCALDAAGAAYCWGGGRMGQLGSGEMPP